MRLAAMSLAVLCLAGCRGCSSQTAAQKALQQQREKEAAEKKKREEEAKQRDPFELGPVTPLLSEPIASGEQAGSLRLAKPGHWTATVQVTSANEGDFEGASSVAVVDSRRRVQALPESTFALVAARPALLAKGREKRLQNELLPPGGDDRIRVRSSLLESGAEVRSTVDPWSMMPSHQYFLLVLAREPARYAFFKVADAVQAPLEDDAGEMAPPHYRVVLADGNKPAPLPPSVLDWTSVAYLVWDEVDPARLDPAQQLALVDWLHWGGRLIVNGPDSLATLRGSFLDNYLPVDAGRVASFDASALTQLNLQWTARSDGKPRDPIVTTRAWSGIELKPRAGRGAIALPGAERLFYECPVGAGSVVVSAIQLAERDFVNWPGFDGFLNGVLLRRPPRRFRAELDGVATGLQTIWARKADDGRDHDAHYTTPLRWFSRDAATEANARRMPVAAAQPPTPFSGGSLGAIAEMQLVVDRPGGLGAWDDFNAPSAAAREALRLAAGVRVPGAMFVVVCLAVYLVVLVPLNWMMFQALNRVEWAWLAAPVIALAATIAVVRQAQLDIGFVRAQTEIAVLELQGDHPRGHLSRYMAFYSSLSTVYDAEFDDQSAVAAPFPVERRSATPASLLGEGLTIVQFEKYDHPRLRGIPVSSASTQFVHSEQMHTLAGPIAMSHPSSNDQAWQVTNRSGLDLSDAAVVHRFFVNGRVAYDGCWLGQFSNGSTMALPRMQLPASSEGLPYAAERAKAAEVDSHKRLDVDPLLKLAFEFPPVYDGLYRAREEWRLIARVDEPLTGAHTTPAASQIVASTVVISHLRCELPPAPEPDVNSPADVVPDRRIQFDDEPSDGESQE